MKKLLGHTSLFMNFQLLAPNLSTNARLGIMRDAFFFFLPLLPSVPEAGTLEGKSAASEVLVHREETWF